MNFIPGFWGFIIICHFCLHLEVFCLSMEAYTPRPSVSVTNFIRIWYSCVRASLVWFYNYSQQDVTISDYLFLKGSTCFVRFPRPSSGAQNCTFSFRYCQPILLQARIVGEIELSFSHQYWLTVKLMSINLLAPELFFSNFSTPVYKMWIIQEPNTLELWNKLHFEEEKKSEIICHV